MAAYIPSLGDIVVIDFDPTRGNEIKKRRPGIVVSKNQFNKVTGFVVVCPITSTKREFPSNVDLDERTVTQGQVITSQLRSLDFRERGVRFLEEAPLDVLIEVQDKVKMIFE